MTDDLNVKFIDPCEPLHDGLGKRIWVDKESLRNKFQEKCIVCANQISQCTCEGDYREAYQIMNNSWNKVDIDNRFPFPKENPIHLMQEELKYERSMD